MLPSEAIDLGYCIHVGLRKYCRESTISQIAYYAIREHGEEWMAYVRILHKHLMNHKDMTVLSERAAAITKRINSMNKNFYPDRKLFKNRNLNTNMEDGFSEPAFHVIYMTFLLFTKEDWDGALTLCVEEN